MLVLALPFALHLAHYLLAITEKSTIAVCSRVSCPGLRFRIQLYPYAYNAALSMFSARALLLFF